MKKGKEVSARVWASPYEMVGGERRKIYTKYVYTLAGGYVLIQDPSLIRGKAVLGSSNWLEKYFYFSSSTPSKISSWAKSI